MEQTLPNNLYQDGCQNKYETHVAICQKLSEIYKKKNTDYGDSFGDGMREYGMIMPVIRIEDKFRRFKRLALGGVQNVKDESIKDTLLDLANYAVITLVEMEHCDTQTIVDKLCELGCTTYYTM